MENLKKICNFEILLDAFMPLTPKGKGAKKILSFMNDRKQLETIYDETDAAIRFIENYPEKVDKIKWHLKRIPRLPDIYDEIFSATDIFIFKKFLINALAVSKNSKISFELEELLSLLDLDNMGEETFALSSKYDSKLQDVREKINSVDKKIKSLKDGLLSKIKDIYKLDFDGKDFLLVSSDLASSIDYELLSAEPYDGAKIVLKPVVTKEIFELISLRTELVKQEKHIEKAILEMLSNKIKESEKQLRRLDEAIVNLDLSIARAFLAKELDLVRPKLGEKESFKIKDGRLLSLEHYCKAQDLKYWTLDIDTKSRNTVLYGSNMCGKTVVLKTIAFLQLSAQYGFFVPAKSYEAPLFDKLALVTDGDESEREGLSAFGREIMALNEAVSDKTKRTLIVFDEFARTTNSTDAVVLLNALLTYLQENSNFNALISTHYDSINRFDEIDFFRMKGVKWQELENVEFDDSLNRINLIQKYIEYVPEKDNCQIISGEAIKIAEILGADISLINNAKKGVMNGNN